MASTARLDELKKKFDENPRRYFAPLANEYRKSGDPDQAIAICRAHLPQQPAHISGHVVLGQALFERQLLEESGQVFQTALELDPENLIALRYLGDIARHSGDGRTARAWYQRVLDVDPRNDEIVQAMRELSAPAAGDGTAVLEADATAPLVAPAPPDDGAETAGAPAAEESEADSPPPAEDPRFAPILLDDADAAEFQLEPVDSAVPGATSLTTDGVDAAPRWGYAGESIELADFDSVHLDPFVTPAHGGADSLALDVDQPDASAGDALSANAADLSDLAEDAPELAAWTEEEGHAHGAVPGSEWSGITGGEPSQAGPESELALEEPHEGVATSADEASASVHAASDDAPPLDAASIDVDLTADANAFAGDPGGASLDASTESEPAAAPMGEGSMALPSWDPVSADADVPVVAEATASAEAGEPARNPAREPDAAGGDLGLEVMEFEPPGRATATDRAAAMEDAGDPLLGHTLNETPQQGGTPHAFVTETMAELYLQQGFRNEALAVYRELLERHPDDESLRERIRQIESGSMSSIGIASLSENVIESAIRRQTAPPTRTVRSFFASLAGRRAPYDARRYAGEEPAEPAAVAPHDAADAAPPNDASRSAVQEPAASATGEDGGTAGDAAIPPANPAEVSAQSLDDLFPDAAVGEQAETAAQTLAMAFARSAPPGRPTRAASSELSLDHVFRGSAPSAPPTDGVGFSFDQFFSDSRPAPDPAPAAASGSSDADSEAHDIEQFTAWLEGLKKK